MGIMECCQYYSSNCDNESRYRYDKMEKTGNKKGITQVRPIGIVCGK
jgi:hypothetical protein